MLTQKKKITKKQLKEDTLVTYYYKAVAYFDEYKKPILIISGAVVLLAVLIYLYSVKLKNDNEKAALELSRVVTLYEMGNYQEAIDGKKGTNILGLNKIVDKYGNTENGEIAKIYLANSYLFLGKLDKAYEYFDDYSGKNPLYKATALAGIAGYYEVKKDYKKAAEKYKEAAFISKENASNPQYLLNAIVNLVKINKKEEAQELIDIIKQDYKTSDVMREIDKYSFLVKE